MITLDSDTQLPRDVARKLVGAAIHPLNRAAASTPTEDRVTRVTESCNRASASRWSAPRARRLRASFPATPASILTRPPFPTSTRIFSAKAISPAKVSTTSTLFEAALARPRPENSLLSHDLFESLFARAALVTDIELLDDYPASTTPYAKRQHRWTRGDWQILRWLFPHGA